MASLFHSLVVCGAGLTLLQCGGRSASQGNVEDEGQTSGASSGGAAGKASGGAGARDGAGTNAGGTLTLGGGASGNGGAATGGPSKPPSRPSAPTEQWGCDPSSVGYCDRGRFPLEYIDCAHDPTRPISGSDCPDGTVFACLKGVLDDEPVLFNCACSAAMSPGCVCPPALDACGAKIAVPQSCTADTSECGCAITCILK